MSPVVSLRFLPTASASSVLSTSATEPESTRSPASIFQCCARVGRRSGVSRHGSSVRIAIRTLPDRESLRAILRSLTIDGQTVEQCPYANVRSVCSPRNSEREVGSPFWSTRANDGALISTRCASPEFEANSTGNVPCARAARRPSVEKNAIAATTNNAAVNRHVWRAQIHRMLLLSEPPHTAASAAAMPSGSPMRRIQPPASGKPPPCDPKHAARVRASHSGSAAPTGHSASAHHAAVINTIAASAKSAAPGLWPCCRLTRSSTGNSGASSW